MLLQLIIVQVLTFLGIVLILRRLLYSESAREVQRLKKLKEENTEERKKLEERFKEAQALYQQKAAEAKEAAHAMRLQAQEEAEELKKKMLDKAKEEADSIVRSGLNAKEKIREEVTWQMRKEAPVLASRIFKELLSAPAKKIIHQELVEELLKKLKDAQGSLFGAKLAKGELICACPLSAAEKEKLTEAIFKKLGYEITLEEKEDSGLISGVVIKLGMMVIDASLQNRLRQIEEELVRS